MDFSKLRVKPLTTSLNKSNIVIRKNHGLDGSSGSALLKFTFDFEQEKGIVTNFKYDSTGKIWTLEVEKCQYLRIKKKEDRVSFDIVDELLKDLDPSPKLITSKNNEKLRDYLEKNVVPLITKKIKYTKFAPQFRFFLSHKAKDKPVMRTFEAGLKFLGYSTWLDESNMPVVAYLQLALKTSIDDCDCLIAWLNEEYFKSDYCKAELLYARKLGKIIIPFGVFSEIKTQLREDEVLKFLEDLLINDPNKKSFFEVLTQIDETLFNFEKMAFPSS